MGCVVQVHGDAVLRILTATGRGFSSPSSDKQSDDFQTEKCGKDMTGSVRVRCARSPLPVSPAACWPASPPFPERDVSPLGPPLAPPPPHSSPPWDAAQRYREAAVAALDASVTAGDVVIIHNFWKGEEDEKAHAHYYEEARRSRSHVPAAVAHPTRPLASLPTPSSPVLLTTLLSSLM